MNLGGKEDENCKYWKKMYKKKLVTVNDRNFFPKEHDGGQKVKKKIKCLISQKPKK